MKSTKWILLAGMVLLLMTMGCDKQMGVTQPGGTDVGIAATSTLPIQYNPGGSWFTYFYYKPGSGTAAFPKQYAMSVANDNGNNGCYVLVWDDGVNIYVQYNTEPNWWLTQVHVDIGTVHDSLAHNKQGNLQPGQFRFPVNKQFDINPYVQQYTVTCPWQASWPGGSSPDPGYDATKGLLICAHSIVCQWDAVNQLWVNFQTGTGASGGKQIDDLVPHECLTMTTYGDNKPVSYGKYSFDGVDVQPGGPWYVHDDAMYNGWCADPYAPIGIGDYEVCLWSVYDPALPSWLENDGWDNVAWLINNWHSFSGGEVMSCQTACWFLLGYDPSDIGYPLDLYPQAQEMYDEALKHDGFRPAAGQWTPVLCAPCPPYDQQLVFIEVDP